MEDYAPYIVGICMVIFLVWRFRENILFLFRYEEHEGRIENWMQAKTSGEIRFYPMIQYNYRGIDIRFRAEEFCKDKPMYPPGTRVKVRNYPNKKDLRKVIYPTV